MIETSPAKIRLKSEEEIISKWAGFYNKPVVSICCTTYNHEPYIENTIIGFLTQETSFPFEIIIHDDASTDKTRIKLLEYEKRYKRIFRIIQQTENQYSKGVNVLFEKLIPHAQGDYIALCEGDDFWINKEKLSLQEKALRENPGISICIHNAIILNERTQTQRIFNLSTLPETLGPKDVLRRRWFAPTASFFFRRKLLEEKNPANIERDIDLLFHMSLKGRIFYSQEPLSAYRYLSAGSLSEKAASTKKELYQHKLRFFCKADRMSHYRYLQWTTFGRIRVAAALVFHTIKHHLKTIHI